MELLSANGTVKQANGNHFTRTVTKIRLFL